MLLTPMTRKAMTITYAAHHGHTDRYGVPYIFHTARVAASFTNEAKACAAWLQDVLEEGGVTLEEIRLAGFGGYICDALERLNLDESIPYAERLRAIAAHPIARAVKLADLRDEMDISRLSELEEADRSLLAENALACRLLQGEAVSA